VFKKRFGEIRLTASALGEIVPLVAQHWPAAAKGTVTLFAGLFFFPLNAGVIIWYIVTLQTMLINL